MSRTLFSEDDDYKLTFEKEEGELFVHVEIFKSTKDVLERILWAFAQFKARAYFDGYEAIYSYTRDDRLFRIFGAEEIGSFEKSGYKFKVGKWELNS